MPLIYRKMFWMYMRGLTFSKIQMSKKKKQKRNPIKYCTKRYIGCLKLHGSSNRWSEWGVKCEIKIHNENDFIIFSIIIYVGKYYVILFNFYLPSITI